MHPFVLQLAAAWMTGLLLICTVLVIRAPHALDRILALDALSLILIAVLALSADATGSAYYLDAALILALLSFVGTVAAARYQSEGRIF